MHVVLEYRELSKYKTELERLSSKATETLFWVQERGTGKNAHYVTEIERPFGQFENFPVPAKHAFCK